MCQQLLQANLAAALHTLETKTKSSSDAMEQNHDGQVCSTTLKRHHRRPHLFKRHPFAGVLLQQPTQEVVQRRGNGRLLWEGHRLWAAYQLIQLDSGAGFVRSCST
jgi:hypothetical protein